MKKFSFKLDKKADKEIIKLAWPSITEQLLQMMVGMVSTIFMGRIGTDAVAAVGMVNMLIGFLQTVFSGLAMGATVIIARVTGEKNVPEAKKATIQSIYMALVVGVVIGISGRIFSEPILKLFFGGTEIQVFNIGITYFNIVVISLPFFVLDIIVSGAMRGAGDTKTPMIITAWINVLNIVLNCVLIFGVQALHIPALGVAGSAIAVTISRVLGVIARILVLYNRKNLKLNLSLKDDYRVNTKLMKRIIKIGIPAFVEQAVMQGGFLILQVIVVTMGTVAMAAYQVGLNVNSLAFFPIFGFAIANTTLVGQSLGEKDYKKAEHFSNEALKITILIGFVLGILMLIFATPLARLYTDDVVVVKQSIGLIRVFGVLVPMLAILNLCSSTLKTAGDIMYVMVTSFVGLWTCRVLLSYVLNEWFLMGMTGIMIGIFFDFSIRSFMYLSRMNKGKWKYLRI